MCHDVASEFFRNEHIRSTPMDPKLMFWCVSYYLGAFGTAWLPYETRCKTGRTSAKVRGTKLRRTFRNERTRSTPLDPKLMFWCVSYYLCAFVTVWLPYKTRCKTGRCSAKVCATKSRHKLLHYIGPFCTEFRKATKRSQMLPNSKKHTKTSV